MRAMGGEVWSWGLTEPQRVLPLPRKSAIAKYMLRGSIARLVAVASSFYRTVMLTGTATVYRIATILIIGSFVRPLDSRMIYIRQLV
jgi:hypothetical protein